MLLFDIKFLSRISKNLHFIIHEMYEELLKFEIFTLKLMVI